MTTALPGIQKNYTPFTEEEGIEVLRWNATLGDNDKNFVRTSAEIGPDTMGFNTRNIDASEIYLPLTDTVECIEVRDPYAARQNNGSVLCSRHDAVELRIGEFAELTDDGNIADIYTTPEDHSTFEQAFKNLGVEEEIVAKNLDELEDMEAEIIRMRVGIGHDARLTQTEVGKFLGLTSEQVRRIEARAFSKMRHSDYSDPSLRMLMYGEDSRYGEARY